MQLIQEDASRFRMKGVEAEKIEYKIVDSPELKMLLSGGVYKDKSRAVIRELSTNAWDAHISAGNLDKPFDLQLPTYKDPTFRIRDYGTGLSKEKMEKMYCQYGNSDKNKDDAYNGCMGIGSKVPFAYAPIWTATSYYNGRKYIYQNAKDEMGQPVLIPVGEFETDEPNGLEVTVPVKQADCGTFLQSAKEVYRPFAIKPRVVSHPNFASESLSVKFQGKGWKMVGGVQTHAVMSMVEYPIDDKFFGRKKVEELSQYEQNEETKYQRLLKSGLFIDFPNGSVQFNIGREELQYTDFTIRKVKERLDEIFTELEQYVAKLFTECKTLWEARLLYASLKRGDLMHFGRILKDIPVLWNGKDIKNDTIKLSAGIVGFKFSTEYGRKPKRSNADSIYINLGSIAIVENDIEMGGFVACERLLEGQRFGTVYLLRFPNDAVKKQFSDETGIEVSNIIAASSVPKPPKQARQQNRENVFSLDAIHAVSCYYRYNRRNELKSYWKKDSADVKAGGVYVEINAWSIVNGHARHDPSNMVEKLNQLTNLGLVIPKVYGIKSVQVEKFNKSGNWTYFDDWYKAQVLTYVKSKNLQQKVDALLAFNNKRGIFDAYGLLINRRDKIKASIASDFLTTLHNIKTTANQVTPELKVVLDSALRLNLVKPEDTMVKSIESKEYKFIQAYPLVKYVSLNESSVPEVIKYISILSKE